MRIIVEKLLKANFLIETEIEKLKLNFKNAKKCYERLVDLKEIIADDEVDEEMGQGMNQEFDEMRTAYPHVFPNNPPPRKFLFALIVHLKFPFENIQYNLYIVYMYYHSLFR